ncbi:hypothetical protein SDC9_97936 [bioreactor metagenome]|uniref:Uncharacterized protein n=1 Tax=bioreactor metagenome TaxID=1076179 RepID=A0A645ADD5_9ZZZZ
MRNHMIPVFVFPFELCVDGRAGGFRVLRVNEAEEETAELVVREFDKRHGAEGMCAFE